MLSYSASVIYKNSNVPKSTKNLPKLINMENNFIKEKNAEEADKTINHNEYTSKEVSVTNKEGDEKIILWTACGNSIANDAEIDAFLEERYIELEKEKFVEALNKFCVLAESVKSRAIFLLFRKMPELVALPYLKFVKETGIDKSLFSDETFRITRNAYKVLSKIENAELMEKLQVRGVFFIAQFISIIEKSDFEKQVAEFLEDTRTHA